MAANYVLKNSPINQKKIDRLVKTIETYAKKDRDEAAAILDTCKARLGDAVNLGTDEYVKLVNSTITSLGQMGKCNEQLLKLANTLHKFATAKDSDNGLRSGSIFAELGDLTKGISSDDEEES